MQTLGYNDMIKEGIKGKDWTEYTVENTVRNINKKPKILLKRDSHIVAEVIKEDFNKFKEAIRLMNGVIRGIEQETLNLITKEIIKNGIIMEKYGITNKLIESNGWVIELVTEELREDTELLNKLKEAINQTIEDLRTEGYQLLVIDYNKTKIYLKESITLNELKRKDVRVDIVKKGNIKYL